ncbi:hypothetical protein G9A89_010643 [Geosiphon pyriformis]|nr:hypothetical protein G9A89_010643 [Geosiphon pyriformis]
MSFESVALATFGVNSLVEIASSIIILWRFLTEPSMENSEDHIEATLVKERKATLAIGIFFIFLALGTFAASITSLVQHTHPDPSVSGVIISSISLLIMLLLFIVKRVLAKKLDSSAMASEASCSLACLKITIVLFLGSLIYRLSSKTWWIDASAALILGCMFAMEGVDLVIWSNSKAFHGGCKKKLKNNEKFLPEMSTTIDVPNEYANNNSISQ